MQNGSFIQTHEEMTANKAIIFHHTNNGEENIAQNFKGTSISDQNKMINCSPKIFSNEIYEERINKLKTNVSGKCTNKLYVKILKYSYFWLIDIETIFSIIFEPSKTHNGYPFILTTSDDMKRNNKL